MPYSDVYNRIVKDDNDVEGLVAYGIYKNTKREFIRKTQNELGLMDIPDDVMEEFYLSQTDYVLDLYRKHAKSILREFLDSLYSKDIEREKQKMEGKYEKLADSVRPSFWYGVLQGIVASFLFVLSGYIILKMNGSWDILLSNLLK
ncbi:MAG: hypothetical protein IJG34_06665 [Synergistaceae bacterium]|nr:hypothetical protein [Synergistaceae bacterium]MBQ9628606.1 hypothetical protein [Synergistaceae bacterium]MBR0069264.1 hypothetical protein [Synergistaceae bacterium]